MGCLTRFSTDFAEILFQNCSVLDLRCGLIDMLSRLKKWSLSGDLYFLRGGQLLQKVRRAPNASPGPGYQETPWFSSWIFEHRHRTWLTYRSVSICLEPFCPLEVDNKITKNVVQVRQRPVHRSSSVGLCSGIDTLAATEKPCLPVESSLPFCTTGFPATSGIPRSIPCRRWDHP